MCKLTKLTVVIILQHKRINSLSCTPKTNIILHVNYILILEQLTSLKS